MAPLKPLTRQSTMANMTTRTATQKNQTVNTRSRTSLATQKPPKRKAEFSPTKQNVKRTAMGDITNAKKAAEDKKKTAVLKQPIKKAIVQAKVLPSVKTVVKPKQNENVPPPNAPNVNGIVTRAAVKNVTTTQTAIKSKEAPKENAKLVKTRLSNEFEKTQESLYSTALEDLIDSINYSKTKKENRLSESISSSESKTKTEEKSDTSFCSSSSSPATVSFVAQQFAMKLSLGKQEIPKGVDDFDKENWDDTFQVSQYAQDIFIYLRSREPDFEIPDYMGQQVCLTTWMRSLLVDWMVEVQESFELNHETLYLGVKLVDMYLSKMIVGKETLQLVGAAAMFIASKYDERIPPLIDDFLYICDGAYTRKELIRMEINILKICDFQLGIPLSYRFLRRYARCAKITMPVLTLARFILEHSLMDYATVTVYDSKLAAASLYLAIRMKKVSGWTPALEFYSGYKVSEITDTVILLNNGLHWKPKSNLSTVRNKYSHKIFFEVAKIPLLKNEELGL